MGRPGLNLAERVALGFTLVVEVATLGFCLVTRPSLASFIAPVLGPWAGYAYGHESCTMASVMPLVSWGALTSLALAGAGLVTARGTRLRPLLVGYFALTLVAWSVLTFLSVANSLE